MKGGWRAANRYQTVRMPDDSLLVIVLDLSPSDAAFDYDYEHRWR